MDEHRSAQLALRRALARGTADGGATEAAAIDRAQLERALAHVASCEECGRRFDVAETLAWLERREETHVMPRVPVDPAALFESALTEALSDPDDVVRRRAAERLGEMTDLGAAAVAALVAAAGEDRDERVRAAALTAVQRLDTVVSLPQWVIDVWSAAPAEAAPYLAGVLARLAAPAGGGSATGVTRLTAHAPPRHTPDRHRSARRRDRRARRRGRRAGPRVAGARRPLAHGRGTAARGGTHQTGGRRPQGTRNGEHGDRLGRRRARAGGRFGARERWLATGALGRGSRGREGATGSQGSARRQDSVQGEVTQEAAAPEAAGPATLFDQIYLLRPEGRGKKV